MVPLVNGVAALLVPNEQMPAAAWRIAHMIEIGWSDFAFGLLVGYLLSRGVQAAAASGVRAAGSPGLET